MTVNIGHFEWYVSEYNEVCCHRAEFEEMEEIEYLIRQAFPNIELPIINYSSVPDGSGFHFILDSRITGEMMAEKFSQLASMLGVILTDRPHIIEPERKVSFDQIWFENDAVNGGIRFFTNSMTEEEANEEYPKIQAALPNARIRFDGKKAIEIEITGATRDEIENNLGIRTSQYPKSRNSDPKVNKYLWRDTKSALGQPVIRSSPMPTAMVAADIGNHITGKVKGSSYSIKTAGRDYVIEVSGIEPNDFKKEFGVMVAGTMKDGSRRTH